jgi:hypothetical protein
MAQNGSSSEVSDARGMVADFHDAEALAACLACDMCGDILKDPLVAPDCMHRYGVTNKLCTTWIVTHESRAKTSVAHSVRSTV